MISKLAKQMKDWGTKIPIKWLLFQQVIEKLKENNIPVSTTEKVQQIANNEKIGITDDTDFQNCLQYFHDIGTIIYYNEKGLKENIILDPKWLVDAFKCLVSDKVDTDITFQPEWETLNDTGELSRSLLSKLLSRKKSDYTNHFLENEDHLIEVMKKFDIIVKMKKSPTLYMPCRMKICTLDEVKNKFIDATSEINKTSWLCLQFDFLPPVFFNHIIARFMKEYDVRSKSDVNTRNSELALYRQIAVFNLTKSGCELLVLCQTPTIVAVQIWYPNKKLDNDYSKCRRKLCKIVQTLKNRYKLKIPHSIKLVYQEGDFTLDRTSWQELNEPEYQCRQRKHAFPSGELLNCWYTKGYLVSFYKLNKSCIFNHIAP